MIFWVVLFLLFLIALIDIKFRRIPSIFLTGTVFFCAFLFPSNLFYGIMGFIMAYLLYEADFFGGIGDIKIMTAVAFLFSTPTMFFLYILLIGCYGIFWKIMWKWRFRRDKQCPFLPVFFFTLTTLILEGLI